MYKKKHIIIFVVLGVLGITYFLVFKKYPKKEAKKLALKACECNQIYTANKKEAYSKFLNNFDNTKYKYRKEARKEFDKIAISINKNKYNCIEKVTNEFEKGKLNFKNNSKEMQIYKQSFEDFKNNCKEDYIEENRLFNKIDAKIRTIIDAIPIKEEIQNDLESRVMNGLFFNKFDSISMISNEKFDNRIEFHLKVFTKKDNKPTTLNINAMYVLNREGWQYSDTFFNDIIITETISNTEWTKISPLKDFTWTSENYYPLLWKTWQYSRTTKTGPTFGKTTLPYSKTYFIKTTEEQPVKVKFTYKPNN